MSEDNTNNLEPIDPSTAQQLYLEHKANEASENTVRTHRYRTNHFVRWCGEENIDNLNDLTGRDIHKFRLWRKEVGELNTVSLHSQMSTLRVFLKWAATIEAVTPNLYTKVMVSKIPEEDQHRDEMLSHERAEEVLTHLSDYYYASLKHALVSVLWETGMRIGAARALDIQDVDLENQRLKLVHRPDTGTRLKNATGGERFVAISDELTQVLADYIENMRRDATDDYGREPLFTSQMGRLARSSMRRYVYNITAPCFLGQDCPGCAESTERKCEEAVSPHGIRRGSITHFLTNDVPVQIVSDRMDVNREVLDKHYDRRSPEVKVEQRRGYLDHI